MCLTCLLHIKNPIVYNIINKKNVYLKDIVELLILFCCRWGSIKFALVLKLHLDAEIKLNR